MEVDDETFTAIVLGEEVHLKNANVFQYGGWVKGYLYREKIYFEPEINKLLQSEYLHNQDEYWDFVEQFNIVYAERMIYEDGYPT